MGVLDGQAVSAAITNPAFLDATEDDTAIGILTLANADSASGTPVTNIQREHNSAASFIGKTLNSSKTDLPSWSSTDAGTPTDNLRERAESLTGKFNLTTGHAHDGSAGGGVPIDATDLTNVRLRGFVQQGVDIFTVVGLSADVTSGFTGKTPGGTETVAGVITSAPWNKVVLRQATGAKQDDVFTDSLGNVVYGRLVESGGVWELFFYVNLSGTETAYSFGTAVDIRYYYQEVFNPLSATAPVFSEFAVIPSDNVTADVLDASTTQRGKVLLGSASQSVGSANSGGTANGLVANANHVHRGISSVVVGASTFYGDLTLTASNGAALTPGSGTIDVSAPALTSSAPQDIGSSASVGVATTSARADHVHRGVSSVARSGSSALYGAVTLSASGGVTLTQALQDIQIDAPALAAVAPNDIASTNQTGVGTASARADHTHKGIRSVGVLSQPQLVGDVVLSAGSNVVLTQVGNTISIAAAGGGGGGGGSAVWYAPNLFAPIQTEENSQNVYLFPQGGDARLVIFLRVPQDYVAGAQAFCLISQYSPSASGTQLLRTVTYLIRAGVDAVSSTANAYTSTNLALTNTVSSMLRTASLDLTNSSGQINGLSPAAGDILRIELYRDTDTDTDSVRMIPSASQIKLT